MFCKKKRPGPAKADTGTPLSQRPPSAALFPPRPSFASPDLYLLQQAAAHRNARALRLRNLLSKQPAGTHQAISHTPFINKPYNTT